MEVILKKLNLEDILEKEMNLWNQASEINASSENIDEFNSSNNALSTISNNLLTSKISETIQNIKIKKQKEFYTSQMPRKEMKNPKIVSSKLKEFLNLSQQNGMEIVLDEDSNDEDIFINKSRKKSNISLSLSTSSSMSNILSIPSSSKANDKCINEKNIDSHSPLLQLSDKRQLAKMKLSAFKYNKNSSNSNSGGLKSNTSTFLSSHIKPDLTNIFSTGDEDDLSYLDVD